MHTGRLSILGRQHPSPEVLYEAQILRHILESMVGNVLPAGGAVPRPIMGGVAPPIISAARMPTALTMIANYHLRFLLKPPTLVAGYTLHALIPQGANQRQAPLNG